jgi:transcriptional regulator with XRE-family HTH domain
VFIEVILSSIDDTTKQVAQAIRNRRERLGLTLRALAAKSGVSSSMISDIEREAKSPTISTLSALAEALEVPLAALVTTPTPSARRMRVVRASERSEFVDPVSGARRDSFGPAVAGSKVEFLRYAVPPRTVAGPFPAHENGTIEHVHLAAGSVRVMLGADAVALRTGDSCTCLADAPHGFDNSEGEVEALVYLVIEPP